MLIVPKQRVGNYFLKSYSFFVIYNKYSSEKVLQLNAALVKPFFLDNNLSNIESNSRAFTLYILKNIQTFKRVFCE